MNCYKCATPVPENSRFCLSCGADLSGETGERTLPMDTDPELQAKLQAELGTDFIIERELGRGGMAAVYLAADAHLGRKVAVKVLPPELTRHGGAGLVERFKREARTAATLDHPHIIPVHRVSTGGKLFWYVMKYLEGESLDDVLKREGQLPVERTVDILNQVAEALAYAHEHRVVHRDVKPANVMIDARGWVTVTDFGIAKAVDTQGLTGSGSMIGTPYYMSPEQCSGKPVTGASDQYSLGVMAYQMLGGHLPFTGESVIDIIRKHCMDPVPPLGVLRPQLPPVLIAVIERSLAKSPEERFASVKEFASAFALAAAGEAVGGARRPRRSITADASPVPAVLRIPMRAWRLATARGTIMITAGGVLALGAAATLLVPRIRGAPSSRGRPAVTVARQVPVAPRATVQTESGPVTGADSARAPTAGLTAPASTPGQGRILLRDVPAGASILLDGRRVRGSRFPVRAGVRHVVAVELGGFDPWADTLRVREGEDALLTVRLRPAPQQAAVPAAAAAVEQPNAAAPSSRPAPVEAGETGDLYVWSSPPIPFSIAGRRYEANPTTIRGLPAGPVTISFDPTDSTLAFERTIDVIAGQRTSTGRIPLPRRQ